jgi:CRISPR-associated protein Csb2
MKLEMKTPIAVFKLEDTAFRPSRVRELSGMTREALIRLASAGSDVERTERLVQGHHPDGLYHFATVPIPSLDAEWKGDGFFRAVAVIGYGITGEEDLRFFEDLIAGLDGEALQDSAKGEIARLCATPVAGIALGDKRSHCWRSITPVVLKGFNNRLNRPILKCLGFSLEEREEVEWVIPYREALLPTSRHPMGYHVADYLEKWPRVHLEIRFREEKSGPLLIGRGKYVGLGLMLPL